MPKLDYDSLHLSHPIESSVKIFCTFIRGWMVDHVPFGFMHF